MSRSLQAQLLENRLEMPLHKGQVNIRVVVSNQHRLLILTAHGIDGLHVGRSLVAHCFALDIAVLTTFFAEQVRDADTLVIFRGPIANVE